MKHKPLPFIFIGILHIIEPLIKILYFKATTPFSMETIISNIAAISTAKEIFEFWFLFPLGGIALLGVKRWSYPVFVGVQVYSIYSHMTYQKFAWPYVSKVPFYSSLLLLVVNTLIIIYFALPEVRKPFFNRSVRWWETRTRYNMSIPVSVSISNPDILHDCEILNVSQTGAFLNYRGIVEDGQIITLHLSFQDFNIVLKAKKMSSHSFNTQRGIGVKFQFENIWEDLYVRKLVKTVAKTAKGHQQMLSAA